MDATPTPPAASDRATALVIIDMQREFLTTDGIFRRPVDAAALLVPLRSMIAAARERGQSVVWVRSVYPPRTTAPPPLRPPRPPGERFAAAPMNDDRLAGGHAGRPCCAPGSPTAELLAPLAAEIQADDLVITKARYSAFGETALDELLRARGITHLLLAGVVANVCVRATAADAFFLGYRVSALSECIGATDPRRWREGIDAIAKWYGEVRSCGELLAAAQTALLGLGAGESAIHYGVLPEPLASAALASLRAEIAWQTMHHKGGVVPREVAIQGSVVGGVEPVYRHPADEQPALTPWTPTADAIRRIVAARLGQELNHGLIQRYLGGASFINPHADKTLDVARGSAIVNLSLGATRTLVLRPKAGAAGEPVKVALPHNSLFVLGWETNRRFVHGIRHDGRRAADKRPDEAQGDGERISLTLRTIATFRRPDGCLFGQGARVKDEAALGADRAPRGADERGEANAMLEAFGQENRDPAFDWDAHYGAGFDVLNFRVLEEARRRDG